MEEEIIITIRFMVESKLVKSIVSNNGEIVKRFRKQTGARISISEGGRPDRIITVSGSVDAISGAFILICKNFEEIQEMQNGGGGGGGPRPPITLRLIVSPQLFSSIIGHCGTNIKEIRKVTGAKIWMLNEMLPNSTEKIVSITGTSEIITQCILHICCIMLEWPPKEFTIPYYPRPSFANPIIFAKGQAYTIQGNYAVPFNGKISKMGGGLLPGLAALGLEGLNTADTGLNPTVVAGSQMAVTNKPGENQDITYTQTHKMTVPKDVIGCVIGKGGQKLEIMRLISGALICVDKEEDDADPDRVISITGSEDAVALAQYLVTMSVEFQKANIEAKNRPNPKRRKRTNSSCPLSSPSSSSSSSAPNLQDRDNALGQVLSTPGVLNALPYMTALGGLSKLLEGNSSSDRITGVYYSKDFQLGVHSPGGHSVTDPDSTKDHNKSVPS